MKYYVSKSAVCPFYTQEERQKVHCKVFSEGTTMHLVFADKEHMEKHKQSFCYNIKEYSGCPFYKIAAQQFEEDGK